MIKKAELEIENLKNIIFNGNILKFERNNEKINKNVLGVAIGEKIIESFILFEKYQIKELFLLCEFPISQKLNLIYRASQDGFAAAKFHSKCDQNVTKYTDNN